MTGELEPRYFPSSLRHHSVPHQRAERLFCLMQPNYKYYDDDNSFKIFFHQFRITPEGGSDIILYSAASCGFVMNLTRYCSGCLVLSIFRHPYKSITCPHTTACH